MELDLRFRNNFIFKIVVVDLVNSIYKVRNKGLGFVKLILNQLKDLSFFWVMDFLIDFTLILIYKIKGSESERINKKIA
jgi:hypothetical protein